MDFGRLLHSLVSCAGKFRSQTPMHIDIFFSFSSFFFILAFGTGCFRLGLAAVCYICCFMIAVSYFFSPKKSWMDSAVWSFGGYLFQRTGALGCVEFD